MLLFLLLLMSWSTNSRAEDSTLGSPQGFLDVEIAVPFTEMQQLYKDHEENIMRKDLVEKLEKQNTSLKSDVEMANRERDLRIGERDLAQKETELYKAAYNTQKEITASAIKLAEVSKPKNDWLIYLPIIGLIIIAAASVL
jgi:hypothetical protein